MKEGYYDKSFNLILLSIDLLCLWISFFIAFAVRFEMQESITIEYFMFGILASLLWVVISVYYKIYQLSRLRSLRKSVGFLLNTIALHLLLISLSFVSFKIQDTYIFPRLFIMYFYTITFGVLLIVRITYYFGIKYYYRNDQFNVKNVVIIGGGAVAQMLSKAFDKEIEEGSSFKVLGYFDNEVSSFLPKSMLLGKLDELKRFCLDYSVNEIYYTKPLTDLYEIKDLTTFTDENFMFLRFVPDFTGFQKSKVTISFFNNVPIVEYIQSPLGGFLNQKIKRAFDVVFSLSVIILVYPFVFPIIALLIKLESEGPVLFKQDRPGKGNELFKCYKFRTMRKNNSTERQATRNDPRITKIGAFLRKTSLDEFPQFINVLQGRMSIVGLRPNLISQLEFYSKEIEKYRFRHFITPGITGWAQVNGYRGETEQIELMKKRVELDAWYIENWSLGLDFKIIFLTVFKLIVGDKRAY